MSTTTVFVELLITGIQASVWVMMLVITIAGYERIINLLPQLEKWISLVSIIVFAFWYSLGIIIDRLANIFSMIFRPGALLLKNSWIRQKTYSATKDVRRIKILASEKSISQLLEYLLSRLRIVRATTLNMILITISCLIMFVSRCNSFGCESTLNAVLVTLGIGSILLVATFLMLGMLEIGYDAFLTNAEKELAKINESPL